MWFFLIKAIAGSIIGAATESLFRDTRLGVWFYNKVDNIYTWAAKRYHIKLVTDEEKQMAKFPILKEKLENMEKRIKKLESKK